MARDRATCGSPTPMHPLPLPTATMAPRDMAPGAPTGLSPEMGVVLRDTLVQGGQEWRQRPDCAEAVGRVEEWLRSHGYRYEGRRTAHTPPAGNPAVWRDWVEGAVALVECLDGRRRLDDLDSSMLWAYAMRQTRLSGEDVEHLLACHPTDPPRRDLTGVLIEHPERLDAVARARIEQEAAAQLEAHLGRPAATLRRALPGILHAMRQGTLTPQSPVWAVLTRAWATCLGPAGAGMPITEWRGSGDGVWTEPRMNAGSSPHAGPGGAAAGGADAGTGGAPEVVLQVASQIGPRTFHTLADVWARSPYLSTSLARALWGVADTLPGAWGGGALGGDQGVDAEAWMGTRFHLVRHPGIADAEVERVLPALCGWALRQGEWLDLLRIRRLAESPRLAFHLVRRGLHDQADTRPALAQLLGGTGALLDAFVARQDVADGRQAAELLRDALAVARATGTPIEPATRATLLAHPDRAVRMAGLSLLGARRDGPLSGEGDPQAATPTAGTAARPIRSR